MKTKRCASCGRFVRHRPKQFRSFCSRSCGAKWAAKHRKLLPAEAGCVCGLPLLSGECLCRLCQLERLKVDLDYPSLRERRISAGPEVEGFVELMQTWFVGGYIPRGGWDGKQTWLDVLLDVIAPLDRREV